MLTIYISSRISSDLLSMAAIIFFSTKIRKTRDILEELVDPISRGF